MHRMLEPEMIQQLLGRRPEMDVLDVRPYVTDRTVMVTGAGGSIGSVLCQRLLEMQPSKLILYEMSEFELYKIDQKLTKEKTACHVIPILGNLSSLAKMQRLMTVLGVDTIYHAAAYKHVPLVERNPIVGLENNVNSAKVLVDAARECGVQNLVLVSTDKAVNPTNVMGASKRLAEYIALCGCRPYKVVRFGNVLWSNGSVLPLFYDQLRNSNSVTITHPDVTRYFMSIGEAVDLILQSTALPNQICVLDMGSPVRIEDIALRLADLLKIDNPIAVEYIGLRPGEKLHEELTLGECLQETEHPYIKSATEYRPSYEEVSGWLRQMNLLCSQEDIGALRVFLQKVVPGYLPSCGIVDAVWLQEYVVKGEQELDDCYARTLPEK